MIIVEDGTGVAGANSYADTSELIEYAEARGIIIPEEEEALESLLLKGMDYLTALGFGFVGDRTFDTQPLDWPRTVWNRYGATFVGVPAAVKSAQIVAALAANSGDILGVTSISQSSTATRKTVGPITVEYSAGGGASNPVSYIPLVYALLRQWRAGSGQPAVVRG